MFVHVFFELFLGSIHPPF